MIASVIKYGEPTCDPTNVVINYLMSERGKICLAFIKNDRQLAVCMLNVGVDDSMPLLRIDVKENREGEALISSAVLLPPPQSLIYDDSWEDD